MARNDMESSVGSREFDIISVRHPELIGRTPHFNELIFAYRICFSYLFRIMYSYISWDREWHILRIVYVCSLDCKRSS